VTFAIDDLLLSLDRRLMLANLFERDDGTWQANMRLRKPNDAGEFGCEYGRGATPSEALFAAFEKVKL
jgi:hypothetical protein